MNAINLETVRQQMRHWLDAADMTRAKQIVHDALVMAGVLHPGYLASDYDMEFGLRAFSRLLDDWGSRTRIPTDRNICYALALDLCPAYNRQPSPLLMKLGEPT